MRQSLSVYLCLKFGFQSSPRARREEAALGPRLNPNFGVRRHDCQTFLRSSFISVTHSPPRAAPPCGGEDRREVRRRSNPVRQGCGRDG